MWKQWTVCLLCRNACGVSNILCLPDDLPPDADIEGIAVRLDRPLDDTTMQQIVDAANTFASYSGLHQDDQMISREDLDRSLVMPTYSLSSRDKHLSQR